MLRKIESKRRRGQQRMRWLDNITDSMDMDLSQTPGDSGGQRRMACCSSWGSRVRHDLATEQQINLLLGQGEKGGPNSFHKWHFKVLI